MADGHEVAIPLGNLAPNTLFGFLVRDFESAWNSMAACNPDPEVWGNFLLARQAMSVLELTSRVAAVDSSGTTLEHFGEQLRTTDRRYFLELPGRIPLPREFQLPAVPRARADRQLLAAIFDLLRNGLAHFSQQIPAKLPDGTLFGLSLAGVSPGVTLDLAKRDRDRRETHLKCMVSPKGHSYLLLRPELMFCDFVWAARAASVFSKGLVPRYFERPRKAGHFDFTGDELGAPLQRPATLRRRVGSHRPGPLIAPEWSGERARSYRRRLPPVGIPRLSLLRD